MLTQAGVPKAPNTKALLPHKGTAVIQTHTSNDAPSTPPTGSSDMMPITLPTEMKSRVDRKKWHLPHHLHLYIRLRLQEATLVQWYVCFRERLINSYFYFR
jgi:hypothetical protein